VRACNRKKDDDDSERKVAPHPPANKRHRRKTVRIIVTCVRDKQTTFADIVETLEPLVQRYKGVIVDIQEVKMNRSWNVQVALQRCLCKRLLARCAQLETTKAFVDIELQAEL
jgi:hypothetical protein